MGERREWIITQPVSNDVVDEARRILYPTEAEPFVDQELLSGTRKKYSFKTLYIETQGAFQPWTDFMEASSDFRRGDDKAAHTRILDGMSDAYGPGSRAASLYQRPRIVRHRSKGVSVVMQGDSPRNRISLR